MGSEMCIRDRESVVAAFMCLFLSYYPVFMCLCLSYFLLARRDEMFAADSGAVHSVHCLTRGDVAIDADGTQLHCSTCDGDRLTGQRCV